jgi:hypothetical protein
LSNASEAHTATDSNVCGSTCASRPSSAHVAFMLARNIHAHLRVYKYIQPQAQISAPLARRARAWRHSRTSARRSPTTIARTVAHVGSTHAWGGQNGAETITVILERLARALMTWGVSVFAWNSSQTTSLVSCCCAAVFTLHRAICFNTFISRLPTRRSSIFICSNITYLYMLKHHISSPHTSLHTSPRMSLCVLPSGQQECPRNCSNVT